MSSEGFVDVGLRYDGGRSVWLGIDSLRIKWKASRLLKVLRDILEFKDVSTIFSDERCVLDRTWWVCHWHHGSEVYKKLALGFSVGGSSVFTDMFAYWALILNDGSVNSSLILIDGKDAEGHLERRMFVGWKSDLWTPLRIGEIRDDSVLINDGCIKDCMEKNLEDDTGEILGVHSQGDCGNVTTDDNEDVTPVIASEKDSIIAPPSTPPGNDLNIDVESGSSWIDYIGPLTSDELDY
ncbi:hypothetical protein Tco_1013440 [Tanacetum coccineum]